MKIIFLKSFLKGRVNLIPSNIVKFTKLGFEVLFENNIGEAIGFLNKDYENSAAVGFDDINNIKDIENSLQNSLQNSPQNNVKNIIVTGDLSYKNLTDLIDSIDGEFHKTIIICTKFILKINDDLKFIPNNIILIDLNNIPRTSRAQSMDILSSQNNIAGYRAVIESAKLSGKIIPMMSTAASNVKPAKFLIIGAGVAGLQAIATAKRLGAQVWACDVRKESKEEVESLGAKFIQIPLSSDSSKVQGGYVTEFADDSLKLQQEILFKQIVESNVIICTAMIRGRRSPVIVTKSMVDQMKPGSVIIDLAIVSGGNCELFENLNLEEDNSQNIQDSILIEHNGVKIYGDSDLAGKCLAEASEMISCNIREFVIYLHKLGLFDVIHSIDMIDMKNLIVEVAEVKKLQKNSEEIDVMLQKTLNKWNLSEDTMNSIKKILADEIFMSVVVF
jgi:H+-translocating NAD(P) transhydrogenase subunit alpha